MYQKEKLLFHSNGNRIEAFLFISFVCFLRQLWQSFCHSQKAPLIAFQTNCPQKNVLLHTKAKNTNIWRRSFCTFYFVCVRFYRTLGTFCVQTVNICAVRFLYQNLYHFLGKGGPACVSSLEKTCLCLKPSIIFQEEKMLVFYLRFFSHWLLEKMFFYNSYIWANLVTFTFVGATFFKKLNFNLKIIRTKNY